MRGVMLGVAAVLLATGPSAGQVRWDVDENARWCDRAWGGREDDRHCELREAVLSVSGVLEVDGGQNGGVEVVGWDRSDVRVVAKVWANARSLERARDIARAVTLSTDRGRLASYGPSTGRGEGWGVSWEVRVPRSMDLELDTHNGGIRVEDVSGSIRFDALNGGVSLIAVEGDVRGRTRNGGLHVELAGSTWHGEGLDVETTNGGVTIEVPSGYSAELETGTENGGIDLDFPVTVRGRIGRRLNTTLGDGGPLVRAMTTNGGVRVVRR